MLNAIPGLRQMIDHGRRKAGPVACFERVDHFFMIVHSGRPRVVRLIANCLLYTAAVDIVDPENGLAVLRRDRATVDNPRSVGSDWPTVSTQNIAQRGMPGGNVIRRGGFGTANGPAWFVRQDNFGNARIRLAGQRGQDLIRQYVVRPPIGLFPVSYTHLDVYKRQPGKRHAK